jgi:ABC-type glycerol-3-phosphate transport system substrate-binding protein
MSEARSERSSRLVRGGGWTRRRAFGVAGAAAGGALAAACGAGSEGAPQASQSTASDAPAKLLVKIRSGPTYEEAFKQGIVQFRQKFPKVEVDYFPEESGWPEKLLAGWAAGAGADVFQAWDSHFWRFAANGVIVNINDLLRDFKKADLDDFVKGQWANSTYAQAQMVIKGTALPVSKAVMNEPRLSEFLKTDPQLAGFVKLAPYGWRFPTLPSRAAINTVLTTALQRVMYQEIGPKPGLQQAQRDAQVLLDADVATMR